MAPKAAGRSGAALIVRTGRCYRYVVLGAGAFGVFVGQFEKAITQGEIDGIAGETATSFRLFVKVGLCHWTHSQRGGRGPAAGGQVSLPAIVKFYPLYVGYATQFLSLAGDSV